VPDARKLFSAVTALLFLNWKQEERTCRPTIFAKQPVAGMKRLPVPLMANHPRFY
jgi:hypothetical protein